MLLKKRKAVALYQVEIRSFWNPNMSKSFQPTRYLIFFYLYMCNLYKLLGPEHHETHQKHNPYNKFTLDLMIMAQPLSWSSSCYFKLINNFSQLTLGPSFDLVDLPPQENHHWVRAHIFQPSN